VSAILAFFLASLLPVAVSPAASQVAGCYVLELGPWQPTIEHESSDPADFSPPRIVRLTSRRGTKTFEAHGFIVRPAHGISKSVHSESWWQLEKSGSIGIWWTTGFGGLSMSVRQTADGLEGEARTFTDYSRPVQTAHVFARQRPCESR